MVAEGFEMLDHDDANEMTMDQLHGQNIPTSFKNSFSVAASRKQLKNESIVGEKGDGRSLME